MKGLKIKNEMSRGLLDAQEVFIKELVEKEGRAVEADIFNGHERERCERIKNSVRVLAELISQGTLITPALEMPKENREKFPDFEKLGSLISETKQIKDVPETSP